MEKQVSAPVDWEMWKTSIDLRGLATYTAGHVDKLWLTCGPLWSTDTFFLLNLLPSF